MGDNMAKKATCPKCTKEVQGNENFKIYKNKKYHIHCYKELVNELYNKTTTQSDSKQELYDYICKLFNLEELTPMIKAQIDKYYTEYEYTYDGMKYTLKYFYETLENDKSKSKGIGIIPYMYIEAKEFYLQKDYLSNCDIDIEKCIIPKKVKIKPIDYSKQKLINIENL